jgi:2-phospho-L-lactate/phosphoenolpyruvate guanylyltransferase
MAMLVVPFRSGGKTRLPKELRVELALAMLGDVLAAARELIEVRVVTDDAAAALVARDAGATVVPDPGGGQGAAVAAGLHGCTGEAVVVNADVPCVTPSDLRALVVAAQHGTFALVEAADGTTNALAVPTAHDFAPLYGEGSADRFRRHGAERSLAVLDLSLQNLRLDVDTERDLEAAREDGGPRTRALLSLLLA